MTPFKTIKLTNDEAKFLLDLLEFRLSEHEQLGEEPDQLLHDLITHVQNIVQD